MPPFAAQPPAHCSTTRMRSRVGFPGRVRSCPIRSTCRRSRRPAAAGSCSGDDQVTCVHAHRHVWTRRRSASGDTRAGSVMPVRHPVALPADPLLVPERADLVARRRLPGDAPAHVLPGPVGVRRLAQVRRVDPLRRIAGIQVVVDVRDHSRAALRARVHEVPDAILLDRAAERAIEVVDLRERRRRREAGILELLREVVGLQLLARAAEERRTPECVLPPVFGTMFITRPAVSDSPRPPDVVNVTSWELPMSAM